VLIAAKLEPGTLLVGRYRVTRFVGRGGMGAVYEVVHAPSGRELALKVLPAEHATTAQLVARFQREAQAQALLEHPNIVEVVDLGALEDGSLYIAMELVRGHSVGDLLEAGPLHPRRALVVANQVLEALGHAHERGIVHRDLKPDNVMIVRAGEPGLEYDLVKLLDFGLVKLVGEAAAELGDAKLTQTGIVFGTPAYMSPEQALGRPVDARSDLYALGVLLFEMLTGRRPFLGSDALAVLREHVSAPPPALADVAPGAPWCTPEMEAVVARALSKTPEGRFDSAAAMATACEAAFVSVDHLPPS
jgi:serine/threonine-protein kinase